MLNGFGASDLYIEYVDGERILNNLKQTMYYKKKKSALEAAQFFADKKNKAVRIFTKHAGEKTDIEIIQSRKNKE